MAANLPISKYALANMYQNLGYIMSSLEYYAEAALAYEKSILYTPANRPYLKTDRYVCLGNVKFDEEKYQEALIAYQKARQWSDGYTDELEKLLAETVALSNGNYQSQSNIPKRSLLNLSGAVADAINSTLPITNPPNLFVKNKKAFLKILINEELPSSIKTFEFMKRADGLWYKKGQQHPSSQWKLANSHVLYNFVVLNEDGKDKIICGKIGHYYLGNGLSVRFAGGILFKKGVIVYWNNR